MNIMKPTDYPDIFTVDEANPTLYSDKAGFEIGFAHTAQSLHDIEIYKQFLKNAILMFRRSQTYKHYKGFLLNNVGIRCCQYHGNIKVDDDGTEMATIEMHHHLLTIFDDAFIIAEHILNNGGYLTTFDLVKMLEIEHTEQRIPTVMLCKTCHQCQHHDPSFFIPLDMVYGKWMEFLQRFPSGVTRDIYYRLFYHIKKDINMRDPSEQRTVQLLSVAKTLENWSEINAETFGDPGIDLNSI